MFSRQFWTVGKFLPSRPEAEKLVGLGNCFFFFFVGYQPHSKGTFFLYTDKIKIKKLCNYSKSIQYKTNLYMLLRKKSTPN